MIENIPAPITFNPYKHHLFFLKVRIKDWQKEDWNEAAAGILKIGNNMLDLYTGELPVEMICDECLHFLTKKKISTKVQFMEWLKLSEYKKIKLSDQSVWIVKHGADNERYIHIHPAKNSKHSIRVRATTLKTVVAMIVILNSESKRITIQEVNEIRKKYLGLSPVKSIQPGKGIYKLWNLFNPV